MYTLYLTGTQVWDGNASTPEQITFPPAASVRLERIYRSSRFSMGSPDDSGIVIPSITAIAMSFMNDPLWRVPILVLSSLMAQAMATPPSPPPKDSEQKEFKSRSATSDIMPIIKWWYLPAFCIAVHSIGMLEVYMILSAKYPALGLPSLSAVISTPCSDLTSKVHLNTFSLVAFGICYIGYRLRVDAFRELGDQFTFELSIREKHKLVTTGPYSIVRHPSYTGCYLCSPAAAIMYFGPGSVWAECNIGQTKAGKILAGMWFALHGLTLAIQAWRIPREEAVLQKEFGDEWKAWAKSTRYKLLPVQSYHCDIPTGPPNFNAKTQDNDKGLEIQATTPENSNHTGNIDVAGNSGAPTTALSEHRI
ncbi:hypothetical protein K474DRAFT_1738489 [Panus rudis PR-1116 ss-1]|nr:hypothetical protein K474DRAFT_1738489 [Panus rudis PR-1116 ss-1]